MLRLKKALCLFLSIVFLFQLLPVTALAADEEASYTNENAQPPTPSATGATISIPKQASTTSRAVTMILLLDGGSVRIVQIGWAQTTILRVLICLYIAGTAPLSEKITVAIAGL